MEETLSRVAKEIKSGHKFQGLQSMSQQWNTIKNFGLLCSTLTRELNKEGVDLKGVVQTVQKTIDSVHEKEKEKFNLNLHGGDYIRPYTRAEKQERIKRYLQKKKRRKRKYFIRYEIRKTLANNRLRNKGKFIKNKKIDINKLIELVKKGISNFWYF